MTDSFPRSVTARVAASNAKVRGGPELFLLKEHGVPILIGLVVVAAITAIMMMFGDYFVREHLVFFYLFPIAAIAMCYSSAPALVISIATAVSAAYFLFPPTFSFWIKEPLQIVELALFFTLAFLASKVASRLLR